jgi:epoxyqueuosine reductase QueG
MMVKENTASELKGLLRNEGADKVGFSMPTIPADSIFADTPYAITIVVRLSKKIISRISEVAGPTHMYYHHYRTVNALIDRMTLRAVMFLQDAGFEALAIPASQTIPDKEKPHHGDFSHKIGAVLSGLGRIGRSSLFIDDDYGPTVRLGTVMTDMELPIADVVLGENGCVRCNRCARLCPAGAIKGNLWSEGVCTSDLVDVAACNDYMKNNYMGIGRGSVCGICIRMCPDSRLYG